MRILSLRSLLIFCLLLMAAVIGWNYLTLFTWARGVVAGQEPPDDCSGGINVPNRYNMPFCIQNDELFILGVNYKPFEYSVNEQRRAERFFETVIGSQLRAAFPGVKIKYATWDYP